VKGKTKVKNNCEVAKKYSVSQGKHPKVETTKPELTPILSKNCHLYEFQDRNECQFHAMSLVNERLRFYVKLSTVCTKDMEEVFYTAKVFTLQNITITLRDNAN
jgi:hypothetical protein